MTPLLSAAKVSKFYGARAGCREVSFDLYPGEVLAIVGESGSGKTTAGRCVLRLIEPTAGSLRFKGTELVGTAYRQLDVESSILEVAEGPDQRMHRPDERSRDEHGDRQSEQHG